MISLLSHAINDYAYSKELFKAWKAATLERRTFAKGIRLGEAVRADAK